MKKIFLMMLAAVLILPAMAQDETKDKKKEKKEARKNRINAIAKQEEEGVVTYRKHTVFGGKLASDGYGFFMEVARAQSVKKALLFQLDISERKHPKEEKISGPYSSSPLIFGKINYFYPIKLGVQQQFLLGNKGNKNGVSVTANAGGGVSLGLLRAYEIERTVNNKRVSYIYDSPDSAMYLSALSDVTSSGPTLFKGWSHIKMTPGAYVKGSLRFDYGKFNEMVNAIEVGVTGDFYSKKIPQMIYQKQKQFFFSAYVAIMFGRRK
jgi:hypothetical protein